VNDRPAETLLSPTARRTPPHDTRGEQARRAAARTEHLVVGTLWDELNERAKDDPEAAELGYAQRQLAVVSRLAAHLATALDEDAIVQFVVDELHRSFRFYLAVVHRLDDDEVLRMVAGAGALADIMRDFVLLEQPVTKGVNGTVARSGQPRLVRDTRLDPDYIVRDRATDPRSELSVPVCVAGRVWGVLNVEELAPDAFGAGDRLLIEAIAAQLGTALHRAQLHAELENALITTLGVLSDGLEAKDAYTADHTDAVADLAVGVARRLGIGDDEIRRVRYAALLHDIGKVAVPTEILRKPAALDARERAEIERHTIVGAQMIARIPLFAGVDPLVRASHEHWDGNGYPDGLARDEIPLGARIVCACDAWHAMTSDRPYRRALSLHEAREELASCAGSQFDPRVVSALLADVGLPVAG
jgi:putative nucleotidyltransferase with HDIG domain